MSFGMKFSVLLKSSDKARRTVPNALKMKRQFQIIRHYSLDKSVSPSVMMFLSYVTGLDVTMAF